MEGLSRSNSLIDKNKLIPRVVGAHDDTAAMLTTNEHILSSNIAAMIATQNECLLRRKEMLHKKWDENVYLPINRRICTQLKRDFPKFMQKKMKIYDRYLDVLNEKEINHQKDHVFLDVISPEYDALEMQRNSIKTRMKQKKDPLHVNKRRGAEELKILRLNEIKVQDFD